MIAEGLLPEPLRCLPARSLPTVVCHRFLPSQPNAISVSLPSLGLVMMIWSFQTIGVEQPLAGSAVFHFTFFSLSNAAT